MLRGNGRPIQEGVNAAAHQNNNRKKKYDAVAVVHGIVAGVLRAVLSRLSSCTRTALPLRGHEVSPVSERIGSTPKYITVVPFEKID